MTPADQWERVQHIFLAVADLAPSARSVALDEMCQGDLKLRAEVESLLRADSTGDAAFSAIVRTAVQTEAAAVLDGSGIEGSRLGAYRLIREIGRGGMGSVYLATRADEEYESNVAIKVVRPGFDTDFVLRRFRRERQILAHLHHPNIGRLYDGGSTEKRIPYLVMEYVQGSRITKYADDRGLSTEDRIRLFLPVCDAVEYAHRAFIIHRDLKPGNILVENNGTPKLLDFGISKLLYSQPHDPADAHDAALATPDYASPEQIVGDPVPPASDIYSLGVVLYELLTGARPHRIQEGAPLAVERAICFEPTIPPSEAVAPNRALARRLAGDLDSIILRAMHKNPDLRYASAEHLAEDLRRTLEHRPVTARPRTPGYRARKFVRRHRLPVLVASAATAALITLECIAVYQAQESRRQVEQSTASERAVARELAQAYDRLGALERSTPESLRAYTAMVEITRKLWENDPSDFRSLTGYGAAQLSLGMAMPPGNLDEKRAALERARNWLTEAVRRNPGITQLRTQLETATRALAGLEKGETAR